MRASARFFFVPRNDGLWNVPLPILPIELRRPHGRFLPTQGLLDSGATVSVLPYRLGLQLGASWDETTTRVMLGGNLHGEARVVLLEARVAGFDPVVLTFAWTQSERAPLILGQINFFQSFDVHFQASRRQYHVDVASRFDAQYRSGVSPSCLRKAATKALVLA